MKITVPEIYVEMPAADIINADGDTRLPDGRLKALFQFFVGIHVCRRAEHFRNAAVHIPKLRVPYPLPSIPAGRRTVADNRLRLVLSRLNAAMKLEERLRVVRMDESPLQHFVWIVVDRKIFHAFLRHGDFPRPPRRRIISPRLQARMGQCCLHHHLALMQRAMGFHKRIVVVERAVVNPAFPVLLGETHAEIHPTVFSFSVQQSENALKIPLLHEVFLDFRQNRRQVIGMHEL